MKVRFTRSSNGICDDWDLVQIGTWEPTNLVEIMATIGQDLRDEGFEVDAERFERSIKQDREAEDA